MTVPGALYLDCPTCEEVTLHEVVHGKASGKALEVDVRCRKCGTLTHQALKQTEALRVPIVISDGPVSRRTTIDVDEDELVSVDDELLVEGTPVHVRSIEVGHEQRVPEARGATIRTIWAVSYEKIRVKFSINVGPRTKMAEVDAAPDEEFTVGDIVEAGGITSVIHSIKSLDRAVRRGSVPAREIVRVYCTAVRGAR